MSISSESEWVKSTCAYCGVGCGIEAKLDENNKLLIRGDESHPANYGRLCSKGLALGESTIDDGRLLTPSIEGKSTDWETALSHVAKGFTDTIKKYGPDAVALYVSGQILTEDYYVANKLIKGYIGSGNIDTNSRLCMSSSVAGHKRAFGSDTVPNCYEDIELADVVVLVGSNLAWCHPVIYQRLKAAKEARPNLKVIVVDPRETDTCDIADLHLALQPGTDVALFNGLLNYLAKANCFDNAYIEQYTEGLDDALMAAKRDAGDQEDDYLAISRLTSIPIAYLQRFYQWFAETDKVVTIYSQGVNQSSAGVDKVNSITNCHLATGRIGREGCGPFSITGQPNAMGGREVGGLANMLAAHMEFGNPEHLRWVKEFWQVENIAEKPGLKAVDLFDAIDEGKVKAVWIMATNPVVSLPDADKAKRALEKCPLVVVSDCIANTDTTHYADVLLPAMGWGEKSGTVTNSERRISRQRQLIASTGQARPDWWIISQVGVRMGYSGFNFTSAADVFREYAAMTGYQNNGQRDLNLSPLANISDREYDQLAPQQWPVDTIDQTITQKRFFAEGGFYTPNRKGQIIAVSYRPPMTQVNSKYPMILNTGRIRDQWHTMTRTGLVPKLGAHKPEPYVQINPQDARCFQLNDGDIAQLNSQWGQAKARVVISSEMNPGQLFIPMHWTGVESSEGRVCALISPDVDPISGQPESKFTPVAIKSWRYQHEGILVTREAVDTSGFEYWVRRRIDQGFLYYLADANTENTLLEKVRAIPTLHSTGDQIVFDNPSRHAHRSATIVDRQLQHITIIAAKIKGSDYTWLDSLLAQELSNDIQRSILTGKAADSLVSGKQICACKQVGELTIINAIQQQGCDTVEAIAEATTAGTGCGSCVPEIKQIIDDNKIAIAI